VQVVISASTILSFLNNVTGPLEQGVSGQT